MRRRLAPYVLILPGGLWLAIFFVVPMVVMASFSLMQGDVVNGFRLTWHWQNYTEGLSTYDDQLFRSLIYGVLATAACIVLAYPVA
jgi:spermidine/putrescine transport system permease protein